MSCGQTFWVSPPQVEVVSGGLPSTPVILTSGASATYTFNRGFAFTDGVVVCPVSCANLGGSNTAANILDFGGGATAGTMATRLLACLGATITAASADCTATAGPGPNDVTLTPGATGLLFASATAGITV